MELQCQNQIRSESSFAGHERLVFDLPDAVSFVFMGIHVIVCTDSGDVLALASLRVYRFGNLSK